MKIVKTQKIAFLVMMIWIAVVFINSIPTRNETSWRLFSGNWDVCILDSLFMTANDTVYSKFNGWPYFDAHLAVGDTSGGDSIKFLVKLVQDGFAITGDSTRAIPTKTLTWKNTAGVESDTITTSGYYAAYVTNTKIYSFKNCWFKFIPFAGHKIKNGIWVKPVISAWNNP